MRLLAILLVIIGFVAGEECENPDKFGPECGLDVCEDSLARRPGLVAQYYDGTAFLDIRGTRIVPFLGFTGSQNDKIGRVCRLLLFVCFVGLTCGQDYFSHVYNGFIRTQEEGLYEIRCRHNERRSSCEIQMESLDGDDIQTANFTANQDIRMKIKYTHTVVST